MRTGIGKYGQVNDIPGFSNKDKISSKIYYMWHNCITRGKDLTWQKNNPSYIGCDVSDDVLILSNFVNWIENEPRYKEFLETYDKISWSIDKDSKLPGNKLYDFQYMTLMPIKENLQERIERVGSPVKDKEIAQIIASKKSKAVKGININNPNDILIYDSINSVKEDGFDPRHVCQCCKGEYKQHKGYHWEYIKK